MQRRTFLKKLAKTSVVIGTGLTVAGTISWFSIDAPSKPLTVDHLLSQLDGLLNTANQSQNLITKSQDWDLSQIFTHCAQSVEYSMSGYPQHKSELFKQTVGPTVFSIFAAKGRMTHNLSDPIPGAPLTIKKPLYLPALKRLQQSLIDFQRYEAELKPHFAYGQLSKQEYALAHVMHFNNHMQQISRVS